MTRRNLKQARRICAESRNIRENDEDNRGIKKTLVVDKRINLLIGSTKKKTDCGGV